jgi:Mn-containing catalase
MFLHRQDLLCPVRVERPDPQLADLLQEAIGGRFGKLRCSFQYMFQGWSPHCCGKIKAMLLATGTEEFDHFEVLSLAVKLNLSGRPGSIDGRHDIDDDNTCGFHPLPQPVDGAGRPFDGGAIRVHQNLLLAMEDNADTEARGIAMLERLYAATQDPGMRELLTYLIARDTIHLDQWRAAAEELGSV